MDTRWIAAALLLGSCAAVPAWADGGLTVDADKLPWPRLQTRVALSAASPLGTDLSLAGGSSLQGGRVMEDFYFGAAPWRLGSHLAGGFRATSGLLYNGRGPSLSLATVPRLGGSLSFSQQSVAGSSALDPTQDAAHAVPYVGFGYTGLSVKGGWGFTADVGVMALNPGSGLRLGKVVAGSQALDEVLRDMQFTPVLQLGLSYSF